MKQEHSVTYREALWIWVKVTIYSFGDPAGQIAVMHRLLVEEKLWKGKSFLLFFILMMFPLHYSFGQQNEPNELQPLRVNHPRKINGGAQATQTYSPNWSGDLHCNYS